MLSNLWNSLSPISKFSWIAFFISGVLGFLSMGAIGYLLYYPVSFLLPAKYGTLDAWHGDWVWPSAIAVGVLWSFGFLLGALAVHYLARYTTSTLVTVLVYGFILLLWAAALWLVCLTWKM